MIIILFLVTKHRSIILFCFIFGTKSIQLLIPIASQYYVRHLHFHIRYLRRSNGTILMVWDRRHRSPHGTCVHRLQRIMLQLNHAPWPIDFWHLNNTFMTSKNINKIKLNLMHHWNIQKPIESILNRIIVCNFYFRFVFFFNFLVQFEITNFRFNFSCFAFPNMILGQTIISHTKINCKLWNENLHLNRMMWVCSWSYFAFATAYLWTCRMWIAFLVLHRVKCDDW